MARSEDGHGRPRPATRLAQFVIAVREGLICEGRGAWRQRRLALVVAWTICLIGWTGALLLPGDPAAGEGAGGPAALAATLEGSRQQTAALQSDLAQAQRMRALDASRLAETPRLLEERPNPVHERAATELRRQEALIADLRVRLTTAQARSEALRRRLAAPPDGPRRRSMRGLLCGVLASALVAAAGTAWWQARRAGIVDHPSQLREHAGLPLLGVIPIALASAPDRQQRLRRGRIRQALAGLALLGLFGSLVAADALTAPGLLPGAPAPSLPRSPGRALPGSLRRSRARSLGSVPAG